MFGEAAADESVFVGAGRSEMARPGFQATNLNISNISDISDEHGH